MTVGVVIGTYGDMNKWSEIAERAIQSVRDQSCPADKWIHVHGDTLANARNQGAKEVDTDWLIFLDADDELDVRYVEEMRNAMMFSSIQDTIYRPATIGVYEDGNTDDKPVMIPRTDLRRRNCIVIGAMCPSALFFEVGGFRDDPVLEDWDLWIRMYKEGALIHDVNHAVYRVHVNPNSRNQDTSLHGKVYREIQKRHWS